jgi:UDP-N-acetylmuramyl pentapeptide phosphotransferase/UDP-N-acetylglucosamine-1-phosphate transferase
MNLKNVGMALIAIGILMMVITGFNFVTREKVVDIGDLEIEGNRNHRVEWPPIAGGVLVVAGVAALLSGKKSS